MVKSWSKIVLVSALIVVLGASLAFGSTSRVRSMAGTADYLSDDSNVFRWYSTLPSYANMIQAELGHWWGADYAPGEGTSDYNPLWSSRALSISHACGEDGKYGTYRVSLLENTIDSPGFYTINPAISMLAPSGMDMYLNAFGLNDHTIYPYDTTPVNRWDAAGGWDINENFSAGLAFTRSSWSWEDEQVPTDDPVEKMSSSYTTIGVGGSWSNNEDLVIDAAFTYGMAGGKWEGIGAEADSSVEWDSKGAIDIAARGFWDWKDDVTLVPKFEYMTANYVLKRAATDYDHSLGISNAGDKVSVINGGVGMNMEVNGDNIVVFAVEFSKFSWEPSKPDTFQTAQSMTVLPSLRLALESRINSWLTTRIGAAHHNLRITETNAIGKELKYTDGSMSATEMIEYVSYFEWTLGAGFNVAEWTIDMELAPETPFGLGYWLTGYNAWPQDTYDGNREYPGPVWRISGTYNF